MIFGGSVITERLYIDVKQDLKKIKKIKKTKYERTGKPTPGPSQV